MRIRPTRWFSTGRLWRAALGGLLGAVIVVAGSAGARAADDDDDDEIFEQKIIKNILGGLGVNVGRENSIDYHERSPLVIPPSRELPAPEATGTVNNPAWPVDPERKMKKKKPVSVDRRNPNDTNETSARAQAELQRGAAAGASRVTAVNPNANTDPGRVLKPSEMGESSWIGSFNFNALLGYKQEEQAPFSGEPPRNSLTQPPVGYQTPSPQYPYGINPNNKQVQQPVPDIMNRGAEVSR